METQGFVRRRARARLIATFGVMTLAAAALVVLLLHQPLLALGLTIMSPSAELLPLAQSYATIRIGSAPAVLVTYTVVGWFVGRQNTRWPMFIVVVTNLTNIALDFLFVMGLGWNSDGAAWATVAAEYLGCALAVYAVWRAHPGVQVPDFKSKLLDVSAYKQLLQSNRHLFFRTISLLFTFAFFTAQGENFGSDTLAANTLMMQLMMMAAYGMDGFATAVEGLAGQRLGGRDMPGFHRAVGRCSYWTLIAAGVVSLAFLLLRQPLVDTLTNIESVQELMLLYFPWLIALPLLAAPSYLLDGVFIGAAETRYMMTTMLQSVLLVYLPLWYLTQGLGNHGLWLSFTAFNLARGITLYYWFQRLTRREQWLRN